jgi:hypothetical protein
LPPAHTDRWVQQLQDRYVDAGSSWTGVRTNLMRWTNRDYQICRWFMRLSRVFSNGESTLSEQVCFGNQGEKDMIGLRTLGSCIFKNEKAWTYAAVLARQCFESSN